MQYQAFENMVMKLVSDAIDSDKFSAEFFSGTLFLNTEEENARSVYHKLTNYAGLGRIQLTKITNGEYAYDFL